MKPKHLISLKDYSRDELEEIFALAEKMKADPGAFKQSLLGKTLAMIFQKPSTRTRVSFEVGMFQLGGLAVVLNHDEIQLSVGESVADTARVLSTFADGIMARVFAHQDVLDLAKFGSKPVINGLSDLLHPCQALADFFTLRAGTFYETSAIPTEALNVTLVDGPKWGLSGGFSALIKDRLSIDAGFIQTFINEQNIKNSGVHRIEVPVDLTAVGFNGEPLVIKDGQVVGNGMMKSSVTTGSVGLTFLWGKSQQDDLRK